LQWFDHKFKGSCIYYQQPPGTVQKWLDYVGPQDRKSLLFSRYRFVKLNQRIDSLWILTASMTDSFHELSVELEIKPENFCIVNSKAALTRMLDPICAKGVERIPLLKGASFKEEKENRKLSKLAGGPQGCSHLEDLIHYMSIILTRVTNQKGYKKSDIKG